MSAPLYMHLNLSNCNKKKYSIFYFFMTNKCCILDSKMLSLSNKYWYKNEYVDAYDGAWFDTLTKYICWVNNSCKTYGEKIER